MSFSKDLRPTTKRAAVRLNRKPDNIAGTREVTMKSARMWGLIAIVVALAAITLSAAGKRNIEMAITLPSGAEPHLTVMEGNTATVEFDSRKFGFVPTFRPGDDSTVNVAVFDMKANPHRRLGQVDVPVSGDRVPSQTTPGFEIRIASVGEWK